jgi:glycosyltransferase involved in cell wall biosynthesis
MAGNVNINISVIIPTYNRGHLISETIESIINQIYRPSEIIVVDDGSTDITATVVAKYISIVKYYKIENSGVCKARNFGVGKAHSDWIAFCDSDDIWRDDKLSQQVELILNSKGVEYCFTNFQTFEDGQWSPGTKFDDSPADYWDVPRVDINTNSFIITEPFYYKVLSFMPIFPSTVMMKKSFFNRIGRFNEAFSRKISEDFEFSLRCVQEYPIGVITKPVVGIRKHEQNFSKGNLPGISFIIGDIDILNYSSQNHRLGAENLSLIKEQIISRSISVVHGAFAIGEFAIFRDILKNIPTSRRSLKLWIKVVIALLPFPLARAAQKCFLILKVKWTGILRQVYKQ